MSIITVDEDNLIEWRNMKLASDGTFVNNAVVTFTLKDKNFVAIAGATNIAMTFVSGSNGLYQGVLSKNVTLVRGESFTLEVQANSMQGFFRIPVRAFDRDQIRV